MGNNPRGEVTRFRSPDIDRSPRSNRSINERSDSVPSAGHSFVRRRISTSPWRRTQDTSTTHNGQQGSHVQVPDEQSRKASPSVPRPPPSRRPKRPACRHTRPAPTSIRPSELNRHRTRSRSRPNRQTGGPVGGDLAVPGDQPSSPQPPPESQSCQPLCNTTEVADVPISIAQVQHHEMPHGPQVPVCPIDHHRFAPTRWKLLRKSMHKLRGSREELPPPSSEINYPNSLTSGQASGAPERTDGQLNSFPERSSGQSNSSPERSRGQSNSSPERSRGQSNSSPERSSGQSNSSPERSRGLSNSSPERSSAQSNSFREKLREKSNSSPRGSSGQSNSSPERSSGQNSVVSERLIGHSNIVSSRPATPPPRTTTAPPPDLDPVIAPTSTGFYFGRGPTETWPNADASADYFTVLSRRRLKHDDKSADSQEVHVDLEECHDEYVEGVRLPILSIEEYEQEESNRVVTAAASAAAAAAAAAIVGSRSKRPSRQHRSVRRTRSIKSVRSNKSIGNGATIDSNKFHRDLFRRLFSGGQRSCCHSSCAENQQETRGYDQEDSSARSGDILAEYPSSALTDFPPTPSVSRSAHSNTDSRNPARSSRGRVRKSRTKMDDDFLSFDRVSSSRSSRRNATCAEKQGRQRQTPACRCEETSPRRKPCRRKYVKTNATSSKFFRSYKAFIPKRMIRVVNRSSNTCVHGTGANYFDSYCQTKEGLCTGTSDFAGVCDSFLSDSNNAAGSAKQNVCLSAGSSKSGDRRKPQTKSLKFTTGVKMRHKLHFNSTNNADHTYREADINSAAGYDNPHKRTAGSIEGYGATNAKYFMSHLQTESIRKRNFENPPVRILRERGREQKYRLNSEDEITWADSANNDVSLGLGSGYSFSSEPITFASQSHSAEGCSNLISPADIQSSFPCNKNDEFEHVSRTTQIHPDDLVSRHNAMSGCDEACVEKSDRVHPTQKCTELPLHDSSPSTPRNKKCKHKGHRLRVRLVTTNPQRKIIPQVAKYTFLLKSSRMSRQDSTWANKLVPPPPDTAARTSGRALAGSTSAPSTPRRTSAKSRSSSRRKSTPVSNKSATRNRLLFSKKALGRHFAVKRKDNTSESELVSLYRANTRGSSILSVQMASSTVLNSARQMGLNLIDKMRKDNKDPVQNAKLKGTKQFCASDSPKSVVCRARYRDSDAQGFELDEKNETTQEPLKNSANWGKKASILKRTTQRRSFVIEMDNDPPNVTSGKASNEVKCVFKEVGSKSYMNENGDKQENSIRVANAPETEPVVESKNGKPFDISSQKLQSSNGYVCDLHEPQPEIDKPQALNDPLGSAITPDGPNVSLREESSMHNGNFVVEHAYTQFLGLRSSTPSMFTGDISARNGTCVKNSTYKKDSIIKELINLKFSESLTSRTIQRSSSNNLPSSSEEHEKDLINGQKANKEISEKLRDKRSKASLTEVKNPSAPSIEDYTQVAFQTAPQVERDSINSSHCSVNVIDKSLSSAVYKMSGANNADNHVDKTVQKSAGVLCVSPSLAEKIEIILEHDKTIDVHQKCESDSSSTGHFSNLLPQMICDSIAGKMVGDVETTAEASQTNYQLTTRSDSAVTDKGPSPYGVASLTDAMSCISSIPEDDAHTKPMRSTSTLLQTQTDEYHCGIFKSHTVDRPESGNCTYCPDRSLYMRQTIHVSENAEYQKPEVQKSDSGSPHVITSFPNIPELCASHAKSQSKMHVSWETPTPISTNYPHTRCHPCSTRLQEGLEIRPVSSTYCDTHVLQNHNAFSTGKPFCKLANFHCARCSENHYKARCSQYPNSIISSSPRLTRHACIHEKNVGFVMSQLSRPTGSPKDCHSGNESFEDLPITSPEVELSDPMGERILATPTHPLEEDHALCSRQKCTSMNHSPTSRAAWDHFGSPRSTASSEEVHNKETCSNIKHGCHHRTEKYRSHPHAHTISHDSHHSHGKHHGQQQPKRRHLSISPVCTTSLLKHNHSERASKRFNKDIILQQIADLIVNDPSILIAGQNHETPTPIRTPTPKEHGKHHHADQERKINAPELHKTHVDGRNTPRSPANKCATEVQANRIVSSIGDRVSIFLKELTASGGKLDLHHSKRSSKCLEHQKR